MPVCHRKPKMFLHRLVTYPLIFIIKSIRQWVFRFPTFIYDLPYFRKISFYFVMIFHFLIVFLILFSTFYILANIVLTGQNKKRLFVRPYILTFPILSRCNIRHSILYLMFLRHHSYTE